MPTDPSSPVRGNLSPEDLVTLNEEIAGMARAGLPLDKGLTALAREMGRGRLQRVTRQLADDLRAGCTLPQALERQKGSVPPFYSALLGAGIRSGRISDVLGTLTLYARSIAEFRNTVASALFYPGVVLLVSLALLLFVAFVILPDFVRIFQEFRLRVPALTRALLFIGAYPLQVLVLPIVVFIAVLGAARLALRHAKRGPVLWSRFVYALPLVGTLIRSARLAAFADLLGILVDQAVPLPEALRLAAAASSDPLLTEGAEHIEADVCQGRPLGEALDQHGLVPQLVVWMIGFGEKQGTLGPALHQVAQLYRRQADTRAAFLRTVLPPFLIVILAGTLGILFIFGLMTPFLGLLEGLSGGKK